MQPTGARVLGQYQIVREIGRGAYGVVYLARDSTMSNRSVAIKILHSNLVNNRTFVANFVREAQIAMRLSDPNVAHVYDVKQSGDDVYLVMQYVEGETLEARMLRGRLPFERVTQIVAAVATALDSAHRVGYLHGDVKPSNILLDNKRRAYLGDFGLARARTALGVSTSGDLSGTAAYISPEQAKEEPLDERSDVYALATVAYEMLTGRLPFHSETLFGYIHQIATLQPPPPAQFDDRISQDVQDVLLKGLTKNPSERYSTALEFAQALQKALAAPFRPATVQPVLTAPAEGLPAPRRTRRPFLALILIVLLAVALGVFALALANNASTRLAVQTVQAYTAVAVAAADTATVVDAVTLTAAPTDTLSPTITPSPTPTDTPVTPTVTPTSPPPTPSNTPVPPTPIAPFSDDFNEGLNEQWQAVSGSIGVALQKMRLLEVVPNEHTEGLVGVGGESWSDVAVEATIRDVAGSSAEEFLAQGDAAVAFVVRGQSDGSGIALLAERDAVQFAWLDAEGAWHLVAGSRVTDGILFDRDTPLRLEATGGLLTGFVDGEPVTSTSVTDPLHGSVSIWIRSGVRATADSRIITPKLDNLTVTPLEAQDVTVSAITEEGFVDEFETGLAREWLPISDNWGMARGFLTLTQLLPDRASTGVLLTDGMDWENVAVEISVGDLFELSSSSFLFEGNSAVALLTRVQPDGSAVGLVVEQNSLAFATLAPDGTWTLLDNARVIDAFDFAAEPPQVIRVEAVAGLYTAFVDETPVASVAYNGPVIGNAGLWMRSAIPINPAAPDVVPKVEFVRITTLP